MIKFSCWPNRIYKYTTIIEQKISFVQYVDNIRLLPHKAVMHLCAKIKATCLDFILVRFVVTIPINISIFAHIELDSELSGRFGVQGNTFSNTFGYLNQYFKMLPESDIPPQVTKLAKAMDALVAREHEIKSLRIKSGIAHVSALMNMSSLYDMIGGHSLDKFIVKTAAEITALQAGEDLLLPGGWVGMEGPGHAMIYQFEKSADGELLFSIYNSGAGIDRHEKTSSIEKGLFSPVKTYTIPQPVDATELNHLIKRLIEPQLLPLPEGDSYDDKTLYQSMDASRVFLHAEHKLQDLSTLHNTTASQLSGTCAQRSIHQMLKANFESLPKYQRFIFDFKMHALKDFIATHPSPPRSPRITRFVQKAVTNNLRILQEPGVFDDEQEQAAAVSELQALQQQLQTDEARLISSFFDMNLDFSLLVYAFNAFCAFLNAIYTYFSPHYLVMKTTSFDEASVYDAESVQPALIARVREAHVLADLAEVIKQCQEQHDANPLWVMEQIEKIIIQLPIPTSSNEEKPYYEPIDFYSSITTATDFEAMANSLDGLHALYADAAKKTLREARLPTQLITSASFLLLRDYFDATGEAVTGTPTFHGYFQAKLVSFFQGFRGYPFLATNHPEYDQRLVDLLHAINRYETAILILNFST